LTLNNAYTVCIKRQTQTVSVCLRSSRKGYYGQNCQEIQDLFNGSIFDLLISLAFGENWEDNFAQTENERNYKKELGNGGAEEMPVVWE